MGKLKKRSRSSNHRANPIGNNKRQKGEDRKSESLRTNKVLPLIAKLSAPATNDRSMALGSIAVLAEEPKFRELLLKEKLLQIILDKSLKDENDEIIVESFGLLRNLVIEEGYDVAVYLWRQNIWKLIEDNLEKAKLSFDNLLKGEGRSGKIETTLLFDYLENLISLTVGLADASDDIFEQIFAKVDPIIGFIKSILAYSIDLENKTLRTSINLLNAILDLIYNFSSQSLEFTQALTSKWEFNFNVLNEFVNEVSRCNELSKVYLRGIALQLLDSSDNGSKDSMLLQNLRDIITIIKDIDIRANREVLLKEVDNANIENLNKEDRKRVESRSKFQAISLSIELITATIEFIAFEMQSEEDEITEDFGALLEFLSHSISEVLISLLPFVEFRLTTLSALNNLTWLFVKLGVSIEDTIASKIWSTVLSLEDIEIEDKVYIFGVLWALAISDATQQNIAIEDSLVEEVLNDFQKTLDNNEISNNLKDEYLTRLVGFLGTVAKKQCEVERNLKISKLFMKLLDDLPKTSSVLVIEILDIFYEIFGDCEFDYDVPVFVNQRYLDKLEELKPAIKTAIKLVDKHKNAPLKMKGDEVFNNLGRFIQYKKTERR